MASSSAWTLFSVKSTVLSTAILSVALALKLSVPPILELCRSLLPRLCTALLSCLRPPYVYLVINGIIITIAASSMHHRRCHDEEEEESSLLEAVSAASGGRGYAISNVTGSAGDVVCLRGEEATFCEVGVLVASGCSAIEGEEEEKKEEGEEEEKKEEGEEEEEEEEEEFTISRSKWMPARRMDSPEFPPRNQSPAEKPLVSSRFVQRRPSKASPEGGRALGVTKPKRHETLENTWKTITEGRPMPLTRHWKKSETWENRGRQNNVGDGDHQAPPPVKKSETFKDRTNDMQLSDSTPSPVKLRKEPSLSHDELNRRVEAFIRKFNQEMRLQRQESLDQYEAMMGR